MQPFPFLMKRGTNNAVVEISEPKMKGSAIVLKVRLLEGSIPKSFGVSSIFIDPTGGGYADNNKRWKTRLRGKTIGGALSSK